MANEFPTLSKEPSVDSWEEGLAFDPTIRTQLESGHVRTGASCSQIPNTWKLSYTRVPYADKALLREHELNMKVGAGKFSWTNPDINDGGSYIVRYLQKIVYKMHRIPGFWDIDVILEEV